MIEATVFTTLRGLVNDRCYPARFPQNEKGEITTIWPAIRYTVVTAFNDADICGTDTVDTDDTEIQVDGVAKTHGAMIALRDQIIAAMQTTSPPCVRTNRFETFDPETRTYRAVLSFTFHPSSSGSP